jgi:hypothetical protein
MLKKIFVITFLVLFSAALLFGTIRGVFGNPDSSQFKNNLDQATKPFELSPERGRYAHIYTLATEGHYYLDQKWADAVYPDVGYNNGKFYSFFAPGISYMALPFFELGSKYDLGQVASFAFISLFTIIGLIFLYKICREIFKLPYSVSLLVPIIFLFGTTAWSYAVTLYQHHVFSALIFISFYSVWKYKQGAKTGWVWAALVWLCYGIAIFIDYPNAILMLPIMVYFLWVSVSITEEAGKYKFSLRWTILLTSIVFIVISGLHAYHNQYYFGNWKTLSGGIVGYKSIVEGNILQQDNSQQKIDELQSEKKVSGFFTENDLPRGFVTLMFSSDRGLFLFCPIMILGFVGMLIKSRKLSLELGILVAMILTNLFLYSSWSDPWGGWAYGPRYLIPSMGILSIFIGILLYETKYRVVFKVLTIILFVYSAAIALLGTLTTNAVPPKVEAMQLGTAYNFVYDYPILMKNQSSSFVYNSFLKGDLTLQQYGELILIVLTIVVLVLLILIPKPTYES